MTPQQDKIAALGIVLEKLPASDQSFAGSLCDQFEVKQHLSERQWYWVDRLYEKATSTPAAAAPVPKDVGNFAGVYALFEKAACKLKAPKIHLVIEGRPVCLAVAGQRSRVPGVVNVSDGGGYGHSKWYGRVGKDGVWSAGHTQFPELSAVEKLLKALALNPAEVAKRQAALTGRCCFCNLKLKDDHSTAAGFGPVCAENFGLKAEWKKATKLLEAVAA